MKLSLAEWNVMWVTFTVAFLAGWFLVGSMVCGTLGR